MKTTEVPGQIIFQGYHTFHIDCTHVVQIRSALWTVVYPNVTDLEKYENIHRLNL
jgi:hypothetical protein